MAGGRVQRWVLLLKFQPYHKVSKTYVIARLCTIVDNLAYFYGSQFLLET